jgi:surfactin synthase thioesterase subunit
MSDARARQAQHLLLRLNLHDTAAVRVFCLPYAGGSATAFREWIALSDRLDAEVLAVELPGHGRRIGEPPQLRVEELGDALAAEIDRPYVVFGHSLGARLGFELCRYIRDAGGPEPLRLFVSGSVGPRLPRVGRGDSTLPDDEFIHRVTGMGGTPAAVLNNPELRELLLPIIRSDFAWGDRYAYVPGPLLRCPITAFAGTTDQEATQPQVATWEKETSGAFRLRVVEGGHFFLHTRLPEIVDAMARDLHPTVPERH